MAGHGCKAAELAALDPRDPHPTRPVVRAVLPARGGANLFVALALTLCTGLSPGYAVQPDEVLPDPALEHRARDLSAGLRCLVCQNQSIDDSDAPLARDLRVLVRERLKAGDSDERVRDFVVQRYGEFVLLKPMFNAKTLLLWLTPVMILAGGALGLGLAFRRRLGGADGVPLTPQEKAALDAILSPEQGAASKLTKDSSA